MKKNRKPLCVGLALGLLTLAATCGLWMPGEAKAATPDRDLAKTPPMGWNSWNWFGKNDINEKVVRECIDAMVSQGLKDAGYTIVVVDGGWRDTKLAPDGELRASPEKFPHGMKVLADYAHSKGLKFGVHTVPGTNDCGGDPVGGFGHEAVQVKEFVDWGLDFIKLDKCHFGTGWKEDVLKRTYLKWSDLLAHAGRPIIFSISAYKFRDWYPGVCQMARTIVDIRTRMHKGGAFFDGCEGSVMSNAEVNNEAASYAGHGYWNDPDMLIVGKLGLTQEEQKSQFALWCVMTAPLMLGNDPRAMTPEEKAILLNRDAIAVDQDPTEQGRRIKKVGDAEVWAKRMGGNRVAVVLLNRSATKTNPLTLAWSDIGVSGKRNVKDIYADKALGEIENSITLSAPPHGCRFLLISE